MRQEINIQIELIKKNKIFYYIMAKIIFILLLLCNFTVNKNFGNSIVQISKNPLIEIHKANMLPNNYAINYLLDSKIERTQIVFLSSTHLHEFYNSELDQMIHLMKLDLSSSQLIKYNDFLTISPYHPFSNTANLFYISKIISVNPLIIYLNICNIN